MKALKILSIIGIILLGVISVTFLDESNIDYETALGCAFFSFGYSIAHGIVAIIQGSKLKKTVLKVMAIIGFVLYVLSFLFIATAEIYDVALGWFIIGAGYGIAFSIVALVVSIKAKKRHIGEQITNSNT